MSAPVMSDKAASEIEGHADSPDRSTCPSYEQIKALAVGASEDLPDVHAHVSDCRWCAHDYRDFLRDREWNKFLSRSTWLSVAVVLILVIRVIWDSRH
jgi:hypothetical protein